MNLRRVVAAVVAAGALVLVSVVSHGHPDTRPAVPTAGGGTVTP